MKTTNKILIGAVAAFIAAAANASYVFSWTLSEDEWQNYSYSVIAAYQNNAKVGYLYAANGGSAASTSPGYYATTGGFADSMKSTVAWADGYDSDLDMSGIGKTDITYLYNNDGNAYTYIIELYNSSYVKVDESVAYTYDSLFTRVYDTGTTSAKDMAPVKTSMDIPEPTGATLLLVGFGLLALRRRKAVAAFCVAFVCCGLFAAENDTIVTFGTKGPDTYADGKTVLDGERYALVYADDASAVTIAADGAISGGTKVAVVALAKGGCLPTVGFQVSATLIENPVRDNFRLFLLDTRLADGTLAPGGSKPTAVNGFAPVEGAQVSVTQISALPEGFTQPKFKKIDVLDDTVVLTIENTLPCIQYTLDEGIGAKGEGIEGVDAKNGAGEIQFIVPKKDGGETFRVIRK